MSPETRPEGPGPKKGPSLRSFFTVSGILLCISPIWYFVVSQYIAVYASTGFLRNRLFEFCMEAIPSNLPPVYENPIPAADVLFFPSGVSCTYTHVVPYVTVVHTDFYGTAVALFPLVVLMAWIAYFVYSRKRRKYAT